MSEKILRSALLAGVAISVAIAGVCATRPAAAASAPQKGVMLINRIGPSKMELYVANADGTGERRLLPDSRFLDYDASFSPDGRWIVFTSERDRRRARAGRHLAGPYRRHRP